MADVKLACGFCDTVNKIDMAKHAQRPKCASCGRPFLLDRPVKVTQDHFDTTVLKAGIPVVVDFYADWCGPCVMMAPLLDELASEAAGRVLVAKVDTDAAPAIGQRYGIRGIPFFARFENGELVRSAVGAQDREALFALAGPAEPSTPSDGSSQKVG